MVPRMRDRRKFILPKELKALDGLTSAREPHIDLQRLALYLDGRLAPGPERDSLEGHLADCSECRRLSTQAFLALREEGRWRLSAWPAGLVAWLANHVVPNWQPALAAAVIILAVGVLVRQPGSSPTPPIQATPKPSIQGPDAEIATWASRVREGFLPRVPEFAAFAHSDAARRLRGFGDAPGSTESPVCGSEGPAGSTPTQPTKRVAGMVPEPLSPRCAMILGGRPTFVWHVAPQLARSATAYEVVLVDQAGDLVVKVPLVPSRTLDASSPLKVSFPENEPALKAHQTYAWKVSALVGGEWQNSMAYVPFRSLDPAQAAIVDEELLRASNDPYSRAVVFAWNGLYEDALQTLELLPKDKPSQERARLLAEMILERKGLTPAPSLDPSP